MAMTAMDRTSGGAAPVMVEVAPTREGYDRWAGHYDAEDNPLIHLEERHLPAVFGSMTGLDVADIGCGTGRHALRWAAEGARVTAIDFSEAMLAKARAKPGAEAVRFIHHDLTGPWPLPSAAFDRVACCLVLDHIGDLGAFFRELRRLVRPSGKALLSAMHPAMSLRGVQARFMDPESGERVGVASHVHTTGDFLMAALRAGLALEWIGEHAADDAVAARSPRAVKYLGWPMLLLLRLAPVPAASD